MARSSCGPRHAWRSPEMEVEGIETFLDDLFVRHVARPDGQVGVLVDRLAFGEKALDGRSRIGGLQQWTVSPALDAAQDDIGIRLEPDRNPLVLDTATGLPTHERAAA